LAHFRRSISIRSAAHERQNRDTAHPAIPAFDFRPIGG
jgi:hypothetical protein